jgi:chromosome segregation ATPase
VRGVNFVEKKSTEKDVKALTMKLGIQVDNLCQFLPQGMRRAFL